MNDCRILIICCEKMKETVERADLPDSAVLALPCLGRIDEAVILRAFRKGADAVIVAGCVEGNCKYNSGNYQARRCVNEVRDILTEIGVSGERLEILNLAPNQMIDLVNLFENMKEVVLRLGHPDILGAER